MNFVYFNHQSSINNRLGGGTDISSFSGKKPVARIGERQMTRLEMQEKATDLFMKGFH
jgi:hypothetical protein